jgi:hypothetical protein
MEQSLKDTKFLCNMNGRDFKLEIKVMTARNFNRVKLQTRAQSVAC